MSIGMDSVSFAYGDTPICRDLTWTLPESGVVCLWGPSGCGKTTLLRLLAGLERPISGQVNRPETVSMVFQEDRLLPWLTALENVTLPGADRQTATEMLSAIGLSPEEVQTMPVNLSGGQQRRVALARALAAEGDLLLLDEPFNGLDEATWQTAVPLIADYATRRPVVLVTHILAQAEALGAVMLPLPGIPLTGRWPKGENLSENFTAKP
ncbi:MAG: ATP-binding cassette domain-containing protein [Clostridia bacterium]|nr:ATP-binding cassette domain-containing protein [Clostridia bacterium]